MALHLAEKRCLKARLAAGEQLYGAFLCSHSPLFAEMMGLAGYDYVVVDLEHGPGETMAALPCLQALQAVGTPAIIRVGFNDQLLLKKALDLGPSGVIVPMVQNAEEAAHVVRCCRYPPAGVRGAAYPLVRASKFGMDSTYLDRVEKEMLIICQIESAEAVDAIPEIANVDGVDGLMIGPRDLSASIGCLADPSNPRLVALMERAEKAVLAASPRKVFLKGMGRPVIDPPSALFQRGYTMVSGNIDILLFGSAVCSDVKTYKPQKPVTDKPKSNGALVREPPHIGDKSNGSILIREPPHIGEVTIKNFPRPAPAHVGALTVKSYSPPPRDTVSGSRHSFLTYSRSLAWKNMQKGNVLGYYKLEHRLPSPVWGLP